MVIDQRNAGATVSNANGYTVDRWYLLRGNSSSNPVFNVTQSSTVPAGFKNSVLVSVGTSGAPGTTNYSTFYQSVEGLNCADLDFGLSTAKTLTLSFWVNCSVTGTYGIALQNSANSRSYITSYTINSANTWEYKTITIAGDTSGTWLTTNGIGISVYWDLGVGTTQSSNASTSWQAGNYLGLTGGTKLSNTGSASFYITGVQLEKGSTATSFDYRPYGTELQLCQRYYWVGLNYAIYGTGSVGAFSAASAYTSSSGNAYGSLMTPVPMRTSPSVAVSTGVYLNSISGNSNTGSGVLSFSLNSSSGVQNSQFLYYTISWSVAGSSGVSNQLAWLNCGSGGVLAFSAEL
jgi:hypothetical protein